MPIIEDHTSFPDPNDQAAVTDDGISALEWLEMGIAELVYRRQGIDLLERYYCGDHPDPKATPAAVLEHRRLLAMSRTNWPELVVDAVAERLTVVGFKSGDLNGAAEPPKEDPLEWRIWQDNNLDADHKIVHRDALALRSSYVLVWPDADMPNGVAITPEHPTQCIVIYAEGSRRKRAAGLKVWWSRGAGGRLYATLYLPDGIYKFRTANPHRADSPLDTVTRAESWAMRRVATDPSWPLKNPFRGGKIPLVEITPNPKTLGWGKSEFEGVLDIVDRINTTMFNRLLAAEFSAFRQKWVTGIEVVKDANGQPISPFNVAVNRLLVGEPANGGDGPEVKFGEFGESDLTNYIKSSESDVNAMAAITKTPPHYLLGAMIQVSGDALKAAETGLTMKVKDRSMHLGEAWEDVMRLAVSVSPLAPAAAPDTSSEIVWAPFESRSEGELVDALVKMKTLGVPDEVLWARWGASPQDVRKWTAMAVRRALLAPVPPATAPGATTAPGAPVGPGAGSTGANAAITPGAPAGTASQNAS